MNSNKEATQALSDVEDLADVVSKAMGRAWNLGQTYWQQADSEYSSQWKRADNTQAKYQALVDETRAAILTRASSATVAEPVGDERAAFEAWWNANETWPIGVKNVALLAWQYRAGYKAEQVEDERANVATPFLTTQVEGDPDPAKQRFRVVAEYRSLDDMHRGHDLFVAAIKAAQSGQRAGVVEDLADKIRAEVRLVLTDPEINLTPGAHRALRYVLSLLAAAPTPENSR